MSGENDKTSETDKSDETDNSDGTDKSGENYNTSKLTILAQNCILSQVNTI